VTKIAARVLLVILGGTLLVSPVFAHATSTQGAPQTNSSKTRKAYLKHQKTEQKKFKKDAKKSQKQIKKQHDA
jgi:hypothetical protein